MENKSCWILCLPRSGSSYLCELLNNSHKFANYEDPRLKETVGPIQKGRAFNEWLRIFNNYPDLTKNPPSYCKAIYHQYIEVMGNVPFEQRRKPKEEYAEINKKTEEFVIQKYRLNAVQSMFKRMSFIHLKRDIYEQSVSTYFARKTKKYHLYSKQDVTDYMNININVNIEEVAKIYHEIKSYYNSWAKMLCRNTKCLDVNYSDLIDSPEKTIETILDFLNIKTTKALITNNEKRIFKMTRPNATLIKNKLIHYLDRNKILL